jgi:hypothetical protein
MTRGKSWSRLAPSRVGWCVRSGSRRGGSLSMPCARAGGANGFDDDRALNHGCELRAPASTRGVGFLSASAPRAASLGPPQKRGTRRSAIEPTETAKRVSARPLDQTGATDGMRPRRGRMPAYAGSRTPERYGVDGLSEKLDRYERRAQRSATARPPTETKRENGMGQSLAPELLVRSRGGPPCQSRHMAVASSSSWPSVA